MTNRILARILWAINALAFVAVVSLAGYAFGQPGSGDPDQPVLAATASTMTVPYTLALVTLPLAALAGSVIIRPRRRS